MFSSLKYIPKFLVIFLIILSYAVEAQTNSYLKSVKASVQGSSSLHDWKSEVTKVEYKGYYLTERNILKIIKNIEVKIPVESIKSTEGNIMDRKTYEAFKSDKNPFITFNFTSSKVIVDASGTTTVETSGSLTMAGTTRSIVITAKGKLLANGDLSLIFSKKLNMTEFKMEPPKAVLGTIKVGEEVTVNFDLVLTN